MLRQRRDHEEDVAELRLDALDVSRRRLEFRSQLPQLLIELVEEAFDALPSEAHLESAPVHFRRASQAGHRLRDALHDAGALLLALLAFPVLEDVVGPAHFDVAEDVWVSLDELRAEVVQN